ncbi:MAG: hypothetical protein JWP91_4062 [Fibrobacteres bacterium]|nr:hypothetical protein [Fibrobacterota bacterium]
MRFKSLVGILPGLMAATAWGSSFTLNPWILIFEPQNKIISQIVTFTFQTQGPPTSDKVQGPLEQGPQSAPVPVEINISARVINLDGSVSYPSSIGADDFVVYPSQFILYPGDTKKIQIQWVGTTVPSKEVSLGFIATQLPLQLKEPKEKPKSAMGLVSIETRYEGIIVIRPKGVKPAVIADTAYSRKDSTGTSLVVLLNNKGTGLQSLKNMQLSVAPLDKNGKFKFNERILVKEVKSSIATSQSVFPGFRRMVVLPWPTDLPVGPVAVMPVFPDAPK